MEIPTVKIKLGDAGDYTIINEADFDPEKHVLFDAPIIACDLPEDLPCIAAIKRASIVRLSELASKSEDQIAEIKGVSKAGAKAIVARLRVLSGSES